MFTPSWMPSNHVPDVIAGCETVEEFLLTNSRLSSTNPGDFVEIMRGNYILARQRGQLERFKAASMHRDHQQYNQLQEDVLLPHLHRARARILLLWSGADATVPMARGVELLKRAPSADMLVFGGAAHMVMIDRPEAFNSVLLAWLQAAC